MTSKAKEMAILVSRLAALREAYVSLAPDLNRDWARFYQAVEQLVEAIRSVSFELDLDVLRRICEYATTALEIYERRPNVSREQLDSQMSLLTALIVRLWGKL